jgi:transglutaminase-like putative cysteine protease
MSSRSHRIFFRCASLERLSPTFLAIFLFSVPLCAPPISAQKAFSWPPINAQDLVLRDPSVDPSAPAIILEYQVLTDEISLTETIYKRIKILREEGTKYASIQIPYYQHLLKLEDIHARITSPDGRSTEFTGPIYDAELVKAKKYRLAAKTFSLPDVQVGSIIEYSYRNRFYLGLPPYFIRPNDYKLEGTYAHPAAEWTVQQDLFVRHALFRLLALQYGSHLSTSLYGIPRDAYRANPREGTTQLELSNVPAFQPEDYSAPAESLKMRADLFYVLGNSEPYQVFWESLAKREGKWFEKFAGKSKTIEREAAALASSGDVEETKLRKIYARVQRIRNLSFETEHTKKEQKQESLKENKSVEDVLTHGYGYYWEINYAFVALARAAGFQAFPVRVASRDQGLFTPQRFDANQLNAEIAEVRLGSVSRYFDPATSYCPFGLLPWAESGTVGIRLDPVQGGMVTTPPPASPEAVTRWEAHLKLDSAGNLQGKLVVTMRGQQALGARIQALELDEAGRQKYLEDQIQPSLPQGSNVKVLSTEGWQAPTLRLRGSLTFLHPAWPPALDSDWWFHSAYFTPRHDIL